MPEAEAFIAQKVGAHVGDVVVLPLLLLSVSSGTLQPDHLDGESHGKILTGPFPLLPLLTHFTS